MRDLFTVFLMALCAFVIGATIVCAHYTGALFDHARDRALHETEVRERAISAATAARDPASSATTASPSSED